MLAQDIISDSIPPLKTSDTGLKALSWMEEFRVSHLPIVNHVDFLGLISEEDILSLNKPDDPLGNHPLSLLRPFVKEDQHIYDVIRIMSELKLSVVPVLDAEQHYKGLISVTDIMQNLAAFESINSRGGIIILEVNVHDYSLSEIAHIVESNDARILSASVTSLPDSTKMELTLKVDRIDLTRILAAFYRYDYVVKASFFQSEFTDDLRNRYDSFMNYLNI